MFILGAVFALWRELSREEAELASSINGIVEVSSEAFSKGPVDIQRTDRLVLMLIDPATGRPAAIKYESPLVPPQTIRIGQENAIRGAELSGAYLLVGITDKDGEIFKVTPGEVFGQSDQPVPLGTAEFRLVLNDVYRGGLNNQTASIPHGGGGAPAATQGQRAGGQGDEDPKFSISGTIKVSPAVKNTVAKEDRLIVLLFDPDLGRPAAFKIITPATLPQSFTITLPPQARENVKKGYFLRVITDKNNAPLGSAEGELDRPDGDRDGEPCDAKFRRREGLPLA